MKPNIRTVTAGWTPVFWALTFRMDTSILGTVILDGHQYSGHCYSGWTAVFWTLLFWMDPSILGTVILDPSILDIVMVVHFFPCPW